MYKIAFSVLFAALIFSGCSRYGASAPSARTNEPMYIDENTLVLFALDAETRNSNAEAVGYYDLLYQKTKSELYRDHAIIALAKGGYYNDVASRLEERRQEGETLSDENRRYLIVALLARQEIPKAKSEALALVKKSKAEQNYMMLAEVYLAEQNYPKALETLEAVYWRNYSESALDKIAVIIYSNMNDPYRAIGRIEDHNKNLGPSLLLTKRLVAFYGDQRDEEGLLKSYSLLYELDPSEYNAGVLIQLYWNANKTQELKQFLERTHANDELLLKIYTSEKAYGKAIPLSQKLYEQTGDIDYLGQKAIYRYEAADKRDKALIDSVIADLTRVVEVKETGYYLNYLGYCMIEYDRDVDAGIAYVKRALVIEPDSGYFIDSLAWGYYKQGRCAEAAELMKRVVELLGAEDPEVKAHIKAINQCMKRKSKQ